MLNTININLKTDIKTDRPTTLPIKLMSQDKNNNQFILRFTNGGEPVTLDDSYTVEVLTKFAKSGASRLTTAKVRQDYATWEFDTAYITQDEDVRNYVYVRKSGILVVSADANCFVFSVDLSEIDKGAGKVAEVYDENYQRYLDEFKENVNFEEIAQAEQARKEAEILREESYEQKVDTAIVEADVVDKVDNKVTELTPQINNLTAQLAQTANQQAKAIANKLSSKQFSPIRNKMPLVTFTDDDGSTHVMPKLKPISVSTGVPFSISLIAKAIETGEGIKAGEAKQLQDDLGWEIVSHGYDPDLNLIGADLTNEQVEYDLAHSAILLRSKGLDVKNFCYPGGRTNPQVMHLASKYYNSATGTKVAPNPYPLRTFELNRLAFPGTAPNNTFAYYKSKVDEAVANNQWLIWMLHCGQPSFDETQMGLLVDLINYIKSIGVKMPTIQEGLDLVGNIIEINDRQWYMNADGTNNMLNTVMKGGDPFTGHDTATFEIVPSGFEDLKMTIFSVNTARSLAPNGQGGIGVTNATSSSGLPTQIFYANNGTVFYRSASSRVAWMPWKQMTTSHGRKTATITITVPASSYAIHGIALGAYKNDWIAQLTPKDLIPNGLTFDYYTAGSSGQLYVKFQNFTTSPITLTNSEWYYMMQDMSSF